MKCLIGRKSPHKASTEIIYYCYKATTYNSKKIIHGTALYAVTSHFTPITTWYHLHIIRTTIKDTITIKQLIIGYHLYKAAITINNNVIIYIKLQSLSTTTRHKNSLSSAIIYIKLHSLSRTTRRSNDWYWMV